MASAADGGRRSLVLLLSMGGVILVSAAVAVTLLVTWYLLHSQTAARDHRPNDVEQAAGQPSNSPNRTMANPAAQVAPPAGVAPMSGVPVAPAPVATAPAPQGPAFAPAPYATAPQPQYVPPPTTVMASAPAVVARAQSLDVLHQIDPLRDAPRGTWTFQGLSLSSPRDEMGVLRLPVTPPAEYRLTVVVSRLFSSHASQPMLRQPPRPSPFPSHIRPPTYHGRGVSPRNVPQPPQNLPQPAQEMPQPEPQPENDEGLNIILLVDGHPASLVLDGFQRTVSGLELIDGREVDQNGTAFHGELLPRMRNVTVVCTVGPGSIDARVDSRTIVHWTGQSDQLSIDPGLAADVGNSLALVSSSQFRIQRLDLVSLTGVAPPSGPPAVVASAVPVGPAVPAGQPAVAATPAAVPSPTPAVVPSTVAVAASSTPSRSKLSAVPSPEALQCVALIEHPMGSGSGFAVGKNLVVTNAHVVEGVFPDEIKVQFGTEKGKLQPIKRILYFDRSRDLSVLEMPSDLAGLTVRGDYTFNSGDRVTLIGNPAAGGGIVMRNAVNRGRFSGMVHIKDQDFYQIDASVNPGWSGGPVLDAEGKVVAIVAMKAADRAVTEIRGAMGKLDQDFRVRVGRTTYNVGLTYGIPASALASVLSDPALQDEERQAEANDKCAARALADRLSFLAELSLFRLQISVPKQVRAEARNLALGKTPAGARRGSAPPDVMDFLPEFDASRLARLLDDEGLKSMESKYREHLDQRIDAIQESESLPTPVKRDLRTLATKLREANKFAEHPATTYVAFSTKVKGFSHDIKEHLKRLSENMKEKDT
jgi:S1-C subfamily serine protease